MSIERGPTFVPEQPSSAETSQAERDLNEIIPILAHGLVRRIEQKGFFGKVRVSALAGETWGVAKSSDNSTDIPNVIMYPRASLSGDRKLANARLRHEIGNLNYPIDSELNALRGWCHEQKISPELLTSLVEATHEASVNYLEMQNSHSSHPEENFRALYEQEVNTQQIADAISHSAPYKQAVDLSLLYSLAQTGLIPHERFEQGLKSANAEVQEAFDKQTRSVLDQAVKMAVPKKQVQLVRDYVWPKFSKLVALSSPGLKGETAEAAPRSQVQEVQERLKKLLEKMGQQFRPKDKAGKKPSQKSSPEDHSEKQLPQQKELSPEESRDQQEAKNLLAENLQEQLQEAQKQLSKLPGQQPQKPEAGKPPGQAPKLPEIGQQAGQMKEQVEEVMREAGVEDQMSVEQLEKLKEHLEQLEEVAKQLSESGALEEELAKPDEEPIQYNIKEYGIDESKLTPEQSEHLQQIRSFAQNTSRIYRTTMRLLMTGYQQKNPKFTDEIIQKMMERGYDVPDFSLYGPEAAQDFLSQQSELGIDSFSDNFLVNFNLPRPLGRFWYRGGEGSKSQAVKEGEIEWGHLYRASMPAIYSSVDRAAMSGLYLNRLNIFGQHDPKKYYYLWEAISAKTENQADKSDNPTDAEKEADQEGSPSDNSQSGEGSEQGSDSPGQGSESGQSGEPGPGSGEGFGAEGGGQGMGEGAGGPGGAEASGGMPTAQEMQEMLSQMQEILNQAGQSGAMPGTGQTAMDQLREQLAQMQQSLEAGGSPGAMAGDLQSAMQQMQGMMGGMEGQSGQEGQGERSHGEQQGSTDKMSGGQSNELGFEKSKIENEASSYDPNHQGGAGNTVEGEGVTFSRPDPSLLAQLKNMETVIGSKFIQQDPQGNFISHDVTAEAQKLSQERMAEIERQQTEQLSNLESLKRQQEAKMEAMYREMSGLSGEALRVYVGYMESMRDLTDDLTDFFIEKFDLDKDYVYERHQRRGARLERDYTKNILGTKEGRPVLNPRSFERKRQPEMPQFVWTIVLDNTGSVGDMIEDEKKLAVALMEVTKRLDIPFEMVIYTEGGYQFLKTFEQAAVGDDLQKAVLLQASIDNQQDTDLLRAAYTSQTRYSDQFKRTHNFIFFLTDGLACSADSLNDLVNKFKKETVILGVGLAQGAQTIKKEFGKNALEVPDSKQLSTKFIRKLEDLVDQTFD